MRIIFATGNPGKMREIREILSDLGMEILSSGEAGIRIHAQENGKTFEENAQIKAQAVHACAPQDIVLADDSGLVIDYLNGEPGVYSSRYMGEDTSYEIKNAAILERMKDAKEEERSARFVCAVCAVLPDGRILRTRGVFEGRIAYEAAGCGGFGYDPIFYVPERKRTSAELTAAEKNAISHRGQALRAMKERLKEVQEEKEA